MARDEDFTQAAIAAAWEYECSCFAPGHRHNKAYVEELVRIALDAFFASVEEELGTGTPPPPKRWWRRS